MASGAHNCHGCVPALRALDVVGVARSFPTGRQLSSSPAANSPPLEPSKGGAIVHQVAHGGIGEQVDAYERSRPTYPPM